MKRFLPDVSDVLVTLGLVAMVIGARMIHEPSSLILAGVGLIALGILKARST